MNRRVRRAAIYARISTDKQNPLSTADQERKCREYAQRNGITVVPGHVYFDEGLSGVGMDRPSLQKLLQAALSPARAFDVILVDDTSRLSRSTESVLSIYRKLHFAGVQLIAVSQNIDSLHDQAETLITIHGLIDSSYVRELAKKTHRGCESAVLRGRHVGGTCFGYVAVPDGTDGSKRLVIEESQARVVKQIFEMSAAGHSIKSIAKKLNQELAGGRGNWCPTGIRSMLKRELYKGALVWNRLKFEKVPETNKRRSKMRDESEWIRLERPELAIVSAELWDAVQARLNHFGKKPSEGRRRGLLSRALTSPYLFSGLLKCAECGGNLIIGTGGGTHVHKKYVCANYFNRGTCGNDLYIRRDVLEERLLARLQGELLSPEVIDYAVVEFGRQLRAALSSMTTDLVGLRQRKEKLEGEIQRFADAIARGGPLDALVEQIATRERDLKAINNRLLSASAGSIEGKLKEIRHLVERGISDLSSLLNRDAVLAKAELRKHLSEIRMTPTEDRKEWHYVAEGTWDLLGTGPNAPVLGLAHSDGCGGQI
ncbi:MAG TPA: recombinase family protein [Candidatus Acidoferrum sp.]|nr:recombinase family protein [Candidatus Acidoferrum sp.]